MNQIDLKARHAVVTGAGRGIGLAIADRLLQSGASVSLWDRDEAALEQAAASLGHPDRVWTARVDVTMEAEILTAVSAAVDASGRVDILVNNAGVAGTNATTWETSPAEWERVLRINLTGPFLCCRRIVPLMLERNYGRIVNIASIAGKEGNPNAAHYSAAKAGVIALTKSMGKELATRNVLVNCVTPAVIETEILKQVAPSHIEYMRSRIPMGRFGKPEEAAALVAWLCSEECSFSTGAVFDLSGGRATY